MIPKLPFLIFSSFGKVKGDCRRLKQNVKLVVNVTALKFMTECLKDIITYSDDYAHYKCSSVPFYFTDEGKCGRNLISMSQFN